MDSENLDEFAKRYAKAWCSHNSAAAGEELRLEGSEAAR
jgi:hypothetical protein